MNEANEVVSKLSAMQTEIEAIVKGRRHYSGFMFRGIEDFLNNLHPLLVKHELVVLPTLTSVQEGEVITKKEARMASATVVVNYKILARDGSFIEGSASGYATSTEGAQVANAQKQAYKVFFEQLLSIPTEKQVLIAENNGYEPLAPAERPGPVSKINTDSMARILGMGKRVSDAGDFGVMIDYLDKKKMLGEPSILNMIREVVNKIAPEKDQQVKLLLTAKTPEAFDAIAGACSAYKESWRAKFKEKLTFL